MAKSLGNTSASSLIKSASAGLNAINSLKDSQAAFEFANGTQDQAAYDKYTSYLSGRKAQYGAMNDPSAQLKALNYQSKLISTDHTYTKNLIQNQALDIQRGNSTPQQKEALLHDLTQKAYQTGDVQFGQTLESQYNSTVTANQNAAQAAGAKGQAASAKLYTEQIGKIHDQLKNLDEQFSSSGATTPTNPQTGKPYTDPATGKPLSMNGLKAFLYQSIHDVADQAHQAGFDDTHLATIVNAANSAFDNSSYQKSVTSLNYEKQGQSPQSVEVTGTDAFGRPVYGLKDNSPLSISAQKDGNSWKFAPRLATQSDQNSANQNPETMKKVIASLQHDGLLPAGAGANQDGTITLKDPQLGHMVRAIVDPTNGNVRYTSVDKNGNVYEKQIDISDPNGRPKNDNAIKTVSDQQLQAEAEAQASPEAQAQATPEAQAAASKANAQSNTDSQAQATTVNGKLASLLKYNPSGNAALDNNVINTRIGMLEAQAAHNQQAAEMAQQARSLQIAQQAAESMRNITSVRQNVYNSYGGGAPIAPVAPKAPSSQVYLPTPAPGQTPAQTFGAVAGAKPSDANIAKGIAASVGINPNFGQ